MQIKSIRLLKKEIFNKAPDVLAKFFKDLECLTLKGESKQEENSIQDIMKRSRPNPS